MMTAAIMRGSTSASIGETPIVRIASISSVSFIVPICAAKAEPDRPATMIAVISTPSSRSVRRPTRLIVNTSAPNWRSCTAPCWRDDDADQEAHQPDDAERRDADHFEPLDRRVEAEAAADGG